jgi:hypothetical protein
MEEKEAWRRNQQRNIGRKSKLNYKPMKTNLENVYQCDHCKKKMRSKGAMSQHEMYCKENPNNKHICFEWCKHLTKEVKENYSEPDYYGPGELIERVTHFTCQKTGKKMYSYLLEKKISFKQEFIIGLIRMPLDCNQYEVMEQNEYGQYQKATE